MLQNVAAGMEPEEAISAIRSGCLGSVPAQQEHLPAALVNGRDAEEVAHGDSLLDQGRSLQGMALAILALSFFISGRCMY